MPFNTIIKGIWKTNLAKVSFVLFILRNTQPLFFQVQKYEENLILVYVSVIMLNNIVPILQNMQKLTWRDCKLEDVKFY